MKKKIDICISLSAIVVFGITLAFTACKNEPKHEDTKEIAEEHNEAKFEDNKEKDAEFLVDVAEFNLQQAELGKLAAIKSNNPSVQEFGKMMQNMHIVKTNELNTLAGSKQISVPQSLTDDNKEDYNNLNKKDIDDFDKKYLDIVIEKHTASIREYTDELDKTTDAAIKKWLALETASLREHLDAAMMLQTKLKNQNQ
jgi:putative membrane protein